MACVSETIIFHLSEKQTLRLAREMSVLGAVADSSSCPAYLRNDTVRSFFLLVTFSHRCSLPLPGSVHTLTNSGS